MSNIAQIQKALLEANSLIAEMELDIAKNPSDVGLQFSIKSLENKHKELEEEFKKEAEKLGQNVLDYRISSEEKINITAMSDVMSCFQKLFSIVCDALENGPKKTADIREEIKKKTALGLAYTYSGSIGIALTFQNDREFIETTLDKAIKETFHLMNIQTKDEFKESVDKLGSGTIKTFNSWMGIHIKNNISAEIKWAKSATEEVKEVVQVPKLKYIKNMLDETPLEEDEDIEVKGNLVGIDTSKKTFHVSTDELDIIGVLADTVEDRIWIVPVMYKFNLTKKIITHLNKEKIHYTLNSIIDID
ncbi:MAG: hypothetical protein LBU09_00575 [Endomicrobium sp.]|nr:hypothetical protein [Endomicrobium sp.]